MLGAVRAAVGFLRAGARGIGIICNRRGEGISLAVRARPRRTIDVVAAVNPRASESPLLRLLNDAIARMTSTGIAKLLESLADTKCRPEKPANDLSARICLLKANSQFVCSVSRTGLVRIRFAGWKPCLVRI